MNLFVWTFAYNISRQLQFTFYIIMSVMFFIVSMVIIYSIFTVKKWSWLVNIIFSISFLIFYVQFFFSAIYFTVFYIEYESLQCYYSHPSYLGYITASLLLPVIMLAIIILLFKPEVKKYLIQT